MPPKLLFRAILYWLVLLACAIGLGALRQGVLVAVLGDMLARAVGTLALCAVIAVLAVRFMRRNPLAASVRWRVGLMWCALTLAFEFLAGHYLMGASWAALWADWNLAAGHLWPLVPATALLAPVLAGQRSNES